MLVSYSQKHQKFEVAVCKEDKKHKVFLDSMLPNISLAEFNRNLVRTSLDLLNSGQRRQGTLACFQKVIKWVLRKNFLEPLIEHISKLTCVSHL